MRLVCPRTTPRVLVFKNLIYDQLFRKNILDLWCRSRTQEFHPYQNRYITQTYIIPKYQQHLKMTEKLISYK